MNAAADYAAARDVFANARLPAYISYRVESHAGFDAINGADATVIVVRTSDGTIVAGKLPQVKVNVRGGDSHDSGHTGNVVLDRPFKPECYSAASASLTTFEAQPAEAIALRDICHEHDDANHDETDFTTLYADPVTHGPIAVVGDRDEHYVKAHIDERFVVAKGFVMPASFTVKVEGSGPMFWLNVHARQAYSDYKFLSERP